MLAQPRKPRGPRYISSDSRHWYVTNWCILLDVIFLLLQKHNCLITENKGLMFSYCHSLALAMYQISLPLDYTVLRCFLLNIFTFALCESRSVCGGQRTSESWCSPVGSVVQTQVMRDAGNCLSSPRHVDSPVLENLSNLRNGPKHIIPHTYSTWDRHLSLDNYKNENTGQV